VAVLVVSNAIQLILVLGLTRRYVPVGISFDFSLWRKIIRESWPIGISIAFNLIYLKGDIVILSVTRTAAEVGLYGAAYKILDVVTVIPMIFMGLVLPLLTASWSSGNKKDFSAQLDKAFSFLSILALPLAFGTVIVAEDLMSLVAGQEFAASGLFLAILMIGAAMVFWGALFGHTIVALGLQRKMILAYAADAAISIILYFVLIPRFGAVAAAWVTVFSEAFIAIATAGAVMWATGHRPSLRIFSRALLASALMAAVVMAASPLHVLLRVLIGMIAYTALLILFKGITKEMISLVTKRPKPQTP
jgi:O-antigen/teichoic acid export membrane protein